MISAASFRPAPLLRSWSTTFIMLLIHAVVMPHSLAAQTISGRSAGVDFKETSISRDSAKSIYDKAYKFYFENPYKTREYAHQLLKIARANHYVGYEAKALSLLGMYNEAIGNYAGAIALYNQSIKTIVPIDSLAHSLGMHYSNLSIAYHHAGDLQNSLSYRRKALEVQKKFDNQYQIVMSYNNLGNLFHDLNQLDSSIYYYNLALSFASTEASKAFINSNLGDVYLKLKQYDKAWEAFNNNYQFLDTSSSATTFDEMDAQFDFGEYYLAINQPAQAIQHLDSAQRAISRLKNKDYQAEILNLYSKYYSQVNQPAKALEYFKKYHMLSDSLNGQKVQARISDLQSDFEITRRELEIENLKNSAALKDATIENNREETIYLTILTGLALVLLIVTLIFLKRYHGHSQKLRSTNAIIKQKHQEIEDLMRESNHRIKNNLQVVSSLLKMQSRNVDTLKAQVALNEAHNRIKTIAMMHQNLQGSESFKKVPIDEFILQLSQHIEASMLPRDSKVSLVTDLQQVKVSSDHSIAIGLIVNELVTNSIKYGVRGGGQIHISLIREEKVIILTIADSGPGFPFNFDIAKSSTLGFRIVNSLTAKLKGSIEITNNRGAIIQITIPYE